MPPATFKVKILAKLGWEVLAAKNWRWQARIVDGWVFHGEGGCGVGMLGLLLHFCRAVQAGPGPVVRCLCEAGLSWAEELSHRGVSS